MVKPVRIFVLGAGGVGSECVRDLLQQKCVSQIAVGDVDQAKVASLVDGLADSRLSGQAVDVRDVDATSKAIEPYDVLVNTLYGELFEFAISAACRARLHYADVYSHPTQHQMRMVADAGITALTNLGSAPGISTVLGRKGCEVFDEPHEVHFSHVNSRLIAPTQAALDFALDYASTPNNPHTGYYVRGNFQPTGPFEGSKLVDFGVPIGVREVYYMPHSQAKTILKLFPQLNFAAVRGTWRQQTMDELSTLRQLGLLERSRSSWRPTRDQIWTARGGERSMDVAVHALHIEVSGLLKGKSGRITYRVRHDAHHYTPFSDWGVPRRVPNLWLTGVAASVGALMLMEQQGDPKGITTPEEFLDPSGYLDRIASRPGIILEEFFQ